MAPAKRERAQKPTTVRGDDHDEAVDASDSEGGRRKQPASKKSKPNPRTATSNDEPTNDPEEEELYLDKSQRLAADMLMVKENEPADFGTIETIRLENFMCHSCLEMKFGPFMNFVVGQNGSGKSAVLTALTLCLGAKAAVTNRGGNIKAFIKEGEHAATVEVHIRNRGDGFRPDVYGETIIVQRSFNRDGVNSYKTKAKSGKIVSNSKKELSDIIDYMSLQVDNPMTVLSQDLARQFLSNSSDEDKYKFFMKGVQLDDLYALYQSMKSQQLSIQHIAETKSEDIRDLREDMHVAEKKFKTLKETDNLRANVQVFLTKHAWAQVNEAEMNVKDITNEMIAASTRKEKMEEKLQEASQKVTTLEHKVTDAKDASENASSSGNPVKEEKDKLKAKFDASREKLSKTQAEERGLDSLIKTAKNKVAKAESEIATEKERLADLDNGRHASLVVEKERRLQQKKDLEQEQENLVQKFNEQQDAHTQARDDQERTTRAVKTKEADLQSAYNSIGQLEKSRSNKMSVYGSNVPHLLSAINLTQWSSGKPIGPIGLHVRLLKPQWSSILEQQLGKMMSAFIVSTLEDKEILMGLMRRSNCELTVFLNKGSTFTFQEPTEEYLTVLRALAIDNEIVKKQLVISNAIEQTILIEDRNAAFEIMQRKPTNVKYCFAMQEKNGWGLNVTQSGFSPIPSHTGLARIGTDLEEQLKSARERQEALKNDLAVERARLQQCNEVVATMSRDITDYTSKKQRLRTDKQRIEDDIESLSHQIETSVPDGRLGQLESELMAETEGLEGYEKQYQDIINEKDRLNEIQSRLNNQLKELNTRITDIGTQSGALQKAYEKATQILEQAISDKGHWLTKIEEQASLLESRSSEVKEKEALLADMIEQAKQVGERVQLNKKETTKEIEKKLEEMNANLEKADARIGASAEQIARDFADKRERYNEANAEVEDLKGFFQAMGKAFEERMERWQYFRSHISATSRAQFHYLMSERDFDGQLVFYHPKGKLLLKVQPSQQSTDTQRGAKTLSGGEKSFSQICLLLALWEAMGSPFRCLDEFDVFMDAVNRGVSMKLIIKAAKQSIGKQFILITPQDVSTKGIDETADVRIVRMPDPQRNQGRLPMRTG